MTLSVTTATSAGGTASVNATTQEIIYTPPTDFVGEDTISYTVSDGSSLTSTGTITVLVSDYSPRSIALTLPSLATKSRISGISLVGTDLLGNAVEMPIEYVADEAIVQRLVAWQLQDSNPSDSILAERKRPERDCRFQRRR